MYIYIYMYVCTYMYTYTHVRHVYTFIHKHKEKRHTAHARTHTRSQLTRKFVGHMCTYTRHPVRYDTTAICLNKIHAKNVYIFFSSNEISRTIDKDRFVTSSRHFFSLPFFLPSPFALFSLKYSSY